MSNEAGLTKPRVVVVVFITSNRHPNSILIGVRVNAFGEGTYALPGGFMEFGEQIVECGKREVMEETGLRLTNIQVDGILNAVWTEEHHHYITVLLRASIDETYKMEPSTTEPHKCRGWEWHDWNNLPDKLFRPLRRIKESGYNPFDNCISQLNCIEFRH